jgi:mRNA interferase RelE/StbE
VIDPTRWSVQFLPAARRQLLAMRGAIHDRLRAAIRALAEDPTPPDSISMRGKGVGLRRLRVGGYRVIYRIQFERVTLLVIRIAPRAKVYEGFED